MTGRSRRTVSRLPALAAAALLVVLSVAFLVFAAPRAAAHNELVSADPADGSMAARPPTAIVLTFREPAQTLGTAVVVTGPTGQVQSGQPELRGTKVRQNLRPGSPAGQYRVSWRVTSADGHALTGRLSFTVAAPAPAPSPSRPAASSSASSGSTPTAASGRTTEPAPPVPAPEPSAHSHGGSTEASHLPHLLIVLGGGALALGYSRLRRSKP